MRLWWLAALLGVGCGGDDAPVSFPGDDVTPRWNVVATGDSEGAAVVALPDGDAVVAAVVSNELSGAGFSIGDQSFTVERQGLILVKLSGDDGSVVASARFEDLILAAHMAAGPAGDIVLTAIHADPVNLGGDDLPAPRDVNHLVARLSGSDLSHVWSRPLDVTANIAGFNVEVDPAGDVIAVLENQERIHVEKLSGADGSTLWTAEPVAEDSEAWDSTTLAGGDVVVAGYSQEPAQVFHPVLLRLAASDGAVVWEKRLAVSGDGATAEQVEAIAGGDLLVTGATGFEDTEVEGTAVDALHLFAARLTAEGDVDWIRDICDATSCYGSWPLLTRLRGSTAAFTVQEGILPDLDVVLRSISAEDGSAAETSSLASSTGDVLGDLALDADGRPIVTGRTGWVIELDGDPGPRGSLFVTAL